MNRAVLVTGQGRLATGLARGLAARGHRVHRSTLPDPSRPGVDRDVGAALGELGRLDLVVHVHRSGAGPTPLAELDPAAWVTACEDEMARAVHLAGAVHAPLAATAGRFVAVVPTFAVAGAAGFAAAAASAEAIRVMVKGAAKQWGPDGVTANCLAVDATLVLEGDAGRHVSEGVALARPALGGPGDPESDLAPLVDVITAPDAHLLTGTTLLADGGVWMAAP